MKSSENYVDILYPLRYAICNIYEENYMDGKTTKEELIALIEHMQVHAGYSRNGYTYMTTPQKALYDSLLEIEECMEDEE